MRAPYRRAAIPCSLAFFTMRPRKTLLAVAGSLCLLGALPLAVQAQSQAELQKKIEQRRKQVEQKKGTERVLTRDIERFTNRINGLQDRISRLTQRQSTLETDLSAKRERLASTQTELRGERQRLTRLNKRLREVRTQLAARLVAQYEDGQPDLMSVVIEADGFSQLLERGEYLRELAAQDRRILTLVTDARKEATATEKRLDALERRQQQVTAQVTERRNAVARVRTNVTHAQDQVRSTRQQKRTKLASVKEDRMHLEKDIAVMERASARIAGQLSGMPTANVRGGTGRFGYPMNGTFTSPFGHRWGRLHAGIDIAAPVGTPIVASDGGRVAIAGWVGGYGNYTCIQHDSRMSTCYAHQSQIGVKVGQQVSKGQTIGLCGNTGNSTGPHLHFEVRIGGTPVNPMSYL